MSVDARVSPGLGWKVATARFNQDPAFKAEMLKALSVYRGDVEKVLNPPSSVESVIGCGWTIFQDYAILSEADVMKDFGLPATSLKLRQSPLSLAWLRLQAPSA